MFNLCFDVNIKIGAGPITVQVTGTADATKKAFVPITLTSNVTMSGPKLSFNIYEDFFDDAGSFKGTNVAETCIGSA